MPSLEVAQALVQAPVLEDSEEVAKLRVELADEAIASFNAHIPVVEESPTTFDIPVAAEAAYLSDVAARSTRERQGLRLVVYGW